MKLIKEIRRRARNIALAAAGKEPLGPITLKPIRIEPHPVKVETFYSERRLNPYIDEIVPFGRIVEHTRREMARELGMKLLENGACKFEIIKEQNCMGLPGHTLSLKIKVVKPEEGEQ